MAIISQPRYTAINPAYPRALSAQFGSSQADQDITAVTSASKTTELSPVKTTQALSKPKQVSPLAAVSILSLILSFFSGGGLLSLWHQQKVNDEKHRKDVDALTLVYGNELTRLKKENEKQAREIQTLSRDLTQEQHTTQRTTDRLNAEQNIDLGQSRTLLQHAKRLNELDQPRPDLKEIIAQRLPSNVAISTVIKNEIIIIQIPVDPEGNPIEDPAAPGMASPLDIPEQKSVLIGSGIWLQAQDGNVYILTNYHVINGDTSDDPHPDSPYLITPFSASDLELKRTYHARLVAGSPQLDLAILRVPAPFRLPGNVSPLEIRNLEKEPLQSGEQVFAIGTPQGLTNQVSIGYISHPSRLINNRKFIMTDAAINSGNSGGALCDAQGRLIGINELKFPQSEGIAAAIPIDQVVDWLKTLNIKVKQK